MAGNLSTIPEQVRQSLFSYLKKDQLAYSLITLNRETKTLLDKSIKDNAFWKQIDCYLT